MKKKILLGVLPSYSIGGAEKVTLTYFNGTEDSPFSLQLFISNNIGPLNSNLSNTMEYNYKRFLFAVPKLLSIIKEKKVKILSTFPMFDNFINF